MSRRTISALALVLALIPLTAGSVSAAACSEQYLLCLNDAYAIGTGAEVECGAEWIGCVGRKLLFW